MYHRHERVNEHVNRYNLLILSNVCHQYPGTLNFEQNRRHYYESHSTVNPTGVVAVGPKLDFYAPHECEGLAA